MHFFVLESSPDLSVGRCMLGQVVVVARPDGDLDMDPTTIFVTIQPTGKNQHHLAIKNHYRVIRTTRTDSLKCPGNEGQCRI